MSFFDGLRGVVGTDGSTLCECRNCGAKLPEDAVECVSCGRDEIAQYDL